MSEFNKPRYEITPQGLRNRLEDIGTDCVAYTYPSVVNKNAISLRLIARTGERISIQKALEGTQPKDHFFQDLLMTVHPGTNPNFGALQVDFNFNQHGDGELRKRIISGKENVTGHIPRDTRDEDILPLTELALHHTMEFAENIGLEEEMGVNNQPATPDEVAEAMDFLNGTSVLDQNSQPVATIGEN